MGGLQQHWPFLRALGATLSTRRIGGCGASSQEQSVLREGERHHPKSPPTSGGGPRALTGLDDGGFVAGAH